MSDTTGLGGSAETPVDPGNNTSGAEAPTVPPEVPTELPEDFFPDDAPAEAEAEAEARREKRRKEKEKRSEAAKRGAATGKANKESAEQRAALIEKYHESRRKPTTGRKSGNTRKPTTCGKSVNRSRPTTDGKSLSAIPHVVWPIPSTPKKPRAKSGTKALREIRKLQNRNEPTSPQGASPASSSRNLPGCSERNQIFAGRHRQFRSYKKLQKPL